MKKLFTIIILAIVVLSVSGCARNRGNRTTLSEVDRVVEFEYKGHKYIMFEEFGKFPRWDITGVVHDPDCPCHNKE